ncbi:MAG: exodeoxyribonuclease VII large subunit [Clostridia bacterium]|nr:exodeoxyribonuclease VII large subunit [Clostridia bacterium]
MNGEIKFLSVSQINEYIKMMMDSNPILKSVWLRAEISNFTNHYRTGHFYFSLKDDGALIRAVMFKSYAQNVAFELRDGMKVLVHGRVSSFVRDGQYQIYVDEILPDGTGALYLAFEQLKKKLESEGLFAEEHKKRLPRVPNKIGIITSPTGAAIQDMINILGRRFPCADVYLYPAQVQGGDAAPQLAEGLKYFNRTKSVDVIIIGRGGGSAEDLWAFNDEKLAYAVYESEIPVISAVGHESDFTICDFVADRRAPTPSAAAELAVPNKDEIKASLDNVKNRMSNFLLGRVNSFRNNLRYLSESGVLSDPMYMVNDRRMELLHLSEKLDMVAEKKVEKSRSLLGESAAKLEALSPLAVVSRGYSVVTDVNGETLKNVEKVTVGEEIRIKMNGGSLDAVVNNIRKEKR